MTAAESGSDPRPGSSEAGDDGPERPAGGADPMDWLTPGTGANPNSRHSVLSVRLRHVERERVERAAQALGFSASAYVRTRVLGPEPNLEAWRGAYQLVLDLDQAANQGAVPVETVRQFREAFEALARSVFPEPEDTG